MAAMTDPSARTKPPEPLPVRNLRDLDILKVLIDPTRVSILHLLRQARRGRLVMLAIPTRLLTTIVRLAGSDGLGRSPFDRHCGLGARGRLVMLGLPLWFLLVL